MVIDTYEKDNVSIVLSCNHKGYKVKLLRNNQLETQTTGIAGIEKALFYVAKLSREFFWKLSRDQLYLVDYDFAAQLYPVTTDPPKCFSHAVNNIFVTTNANHQILIVK